MRNGREATQGMAGQATECNSVLYSKHRCATWSGVALRDCRSITPDFLPSSSPFGRHFDWVSAIRACPTSRDRSSLPCFLRFRCADLADRCAGPLQRSPGFRVRSFPTCTGSPTALEPRTPARLTRSSLWHTFNLYLSPASTGATNGTSLGSGIDDPDLATCTVRNLGCNPKLPI